jgi:hypothetical protein
MDKASLHVMRLPLVLIWLLTSLPAEGLVIYRFGGEQIALPAEADEPGVVLTQRAWEDLDPEKGGEANEVDVTTRAIGALRRDPEFNLAPTAEEHGGIWIQPGFNGQVWDGDPSTVWALPSYLCSELQAYWYYCNDDFSNPGTANIALPGLFKIDRIRVISGLTDASRTVQTVRVFLAREEPDVPGGGRRPTHWHPGPFVPALVEIRDNREQILDIPIQDVGEAGFVQVAIGEHQENWEIQDIHVYAKGFVSRSTYTSEIIDFGQPMAWGEMRWLGTKGDRAKVSVLTRSGTDADPIRYWRYTGRGTDREEVTADAYGRLGVGEKAGTTDDNNNWGFWSAYEFGDSLGTQIVSPSSRRYFQFRVDILPRDDDGGEISMLEFRASRPLATALVGEVWPVEAKAGEETDFTYVMKPTFGSGETGFNRVEILSSSLLGSVDDVRVGDTPVGFTVAKQDPHHLTLDIPRVQAGDSGALVEVDFKARVLRYGASFDVRVSDGERPLEVPQGASAGDATGEYEGDGVAVATSARGNQLLRVRVDPPVITPNGDGTNDEAVLLFEVLEVTGQMGVGVEIRDLTGHLVRQLQDQDQSVGTYEQRWDGRDDHGQLVPPGIYLIVVSADTDGSSFEEMRVLHLAY